MSALPSHSGALQRYQDAFAHALLQPDASANLDPEIAALVRQPGFNVYRNTVMKACLDALQANYPAVARLVGDDWFRAAASIYVRANLPKDPALVLYGREFESFLTAFEPAAELPYLPGVARLDRFWSEVHTAPDEATVDARLLADADPRVRSHLRAQPHAAARWAWFDTFPIFTIWQRNREAGPIDESTFEWEGEGALVVRRLGVVHWIALGVADCALLDACAAGETIARAITVARAADPCADVEARLAALLEAGALASMTLHETLVEESLE